MTNCTITLEEKDELLKSITAPTGRRFVELLFESGQVRTVDVCRTIAANNPSHVARVFVNPYAYRLGLMITCAPPANHFMNRYGEKTNEYFWFFVRVQAANDAVYSEGGSDAKTQAI